MYFLFLGSLSHLQHFVFRLAHLVYMELNNLRHSNGAKVAVCYHSNNFSSPWQQGPVVNFNLLYPDGSHVGFAKVREEWGVPL